MVDEVSVDSIQEAARRKQRRPPGGSGPPAFPFKGTFHLFHAETKVEQRAKSSKDPANAAHPGPQSIILSFIGENTTWFLASGPCFELAHYSCFFSLQFSNIISVFFFLRARAAFLSSR